jgi:hypothetical protein
MFAAYYFQNNLWQTNKGTIRNIFFLFSSLFPSPSPASDLMGAAGALST